VLVNILPGLRELRAPLAAGYVWLLVGWLAFRGSFATPEPARDFLDEFSAVGEAAALSFGAYMVGALLSDGLAPFWDWLRRERLSVRLDRWLRDEHRSIETCKQLFGHFDYGASGAPPGFRAETELGSGTVALPDAQANLWRGEATCAAVHVARNVAQEPLSRRGIETINRLAIPRWVSEPGARQVDLASLIKSVEKRVGSIAGELDIARFRLLSEERDLSNEVDRLRGEGQFRLALAAPLSALAVTLSITEHSAWAWGLLAMVALAWQGMDRLEDGGDRVVEALRAGKVSIPSLAGEGDAGDASAPNQPPTASVAESRNGEGVSSQAR
jgi:hypothetical protein